MKTEYPSKNPAGDRGSLLIVAMLLTAVLGIALATHIRLSRVSLELSNRGFYQNAAVNLAETGLEHAIWSINKMVDGDATAWDGWTTSGPNAWRVWENFTYDQNSVGKVRVYVRNYNGVSAPVLTARATIEMAHGAPVEKWIEVTLRKRSKFANGLVAKQSIIFKGNNASVDSWNSEKEPDGTPRASPVDYAAAYRNDNGSAGSISVSVEAILLNNADIWGFAATGGAQPSVGSQGSILGEDSPSGAKVDPARVSTDFTANFDPEPMPSGGTTVASIGSTIGTTGTTTTVRYAGSISGSLVVKGHVTLILTAGSPTKVINQTGNDQIEIELGGSLTVYTEGDIKIAGKGILNPNTQPKSVMIYGTKSSGSPQEIDIKGNGALKSVVYAPNGNVFVNGNGDVMGSIVANNITMVGNAAFHYDESLADLDTGNPYGITRWRELTLASERSVYASLLNF